MKDLFGLADQNFRSADLSLQNCYREKGPNKAVRQVVFTNLSSFLLTDFYEGLAHNHYPRRCPVCKRYFLMERAYRQKYCKGYAPMELTGGKQILCADFTLPVDTALRKRLPLRARSLVSTKTPLPLCAPITDVENVRNRKEKLPSVWRSSVGMRQSVIRSTPTGGIGRRSNSSVCLQTWGCRRERQQQDVHLFRSNR